MEGTANVGFGFRTPILRNLEVVASYTFFEREYTLGAGYSFLESRAPIKGQIDFQYYTYKRVYYSPETGVTQARKNFLYAQIDFSAKPVLGLAAPVVNLGYDTDTERIGCGLGLDVGLSQKFSLIGEYFPRLWKKNYTDRQMFDTFAFGLKIQTWGHHFLFMLGNSTEIGTRRMMQGSNVEDLFLGITIQRLLEF